MAFKMPSYCRDDATLHQSTNNLAPGKCFRLLGVCPSSDSTCRHWINHSLWLSKCPIIAPMQGCIVAAITPPGKSSPYVSPSNTALRSPWGAFRRGFRRVPRSSDSGLVVTSRPGPFPPSSLCCKHRMLWSTRHRTARTIRAEY